MNLKNIVEKKQVKSAKLTKVKIIMFKDTKVVKPVKKIMRMLKLKIKIINGGENIEQHEFFYVVDRSINW